MVLSYGGRPLVSLASAPLVIPEGAFITSDSPHPGVRYTIDVGPGDAGMRVSLRRRLPDGRFADVLGVLESWQDDLVAVRRQDGRLVELTAVDVVAAKRIPPPPVRRRRDLPGPAAVPPVGGEPVGGEPVGGEPADAPAPRPPEMP